MKTLKMLFVITVLGAASCGGVEQKPGTPDAFIPAPEPDAFVAQPDTAPAATDTSAVPDSAVTPDMKMPPDTAPAAVDLAVAETSTDAPDAGTPDLVAPGIDTASIETWVIDATPIGFGNPDTAPDKFDVQGQDMGADTTPVIIPPEKKDASVTPDTPPDTQPLPDLAPITPDTPPVIPSSLTVSLTPSPASVTAVKGVAVHALGIDMAAGAVSDIKVAQIALRAYIDLDGNGAFTANEADSLAVAHQAGGVVSSISIWDWDTQIGSAQTPDINGDAVFGSLNWTIPAGTTKHLLVRILLSTDAPYGTAPNLVMIDLLGTGVNNATSKIIAMDKDNNNVTAMSASWAAGDSHLNWNVDGSSAGSSFAAGTGAPVVAVKVIASGSLTIKIADDSPASTIVNANTTDNAVAKIKFTATNEAFNVARLTVMNTVQASSRSITSIRLFDKAGTLFCSGALDNNSRLRCANDAGLFTVDLEHTITVKANIDHDGPGEFGAHSGDRLQLALFIDKASGYADDIKAVGVSSGATLVDADAGDQGSLQFNSGLIKAYDDEPDATNDPVYVSGPVHTVYKTQPYVATVAASTAMMSGENTLYKFSVTAATNADVSLKRFIVTSYFDNVGGVGNARLLVNDFPNNDASINVPGGTWGVDLKTSTITNPAGTIQIMIAADTEIMITSGTTKVFELRATLTGVHDGSTVISYIAADPFDSAIGTIGSHPSNYFLWSDGSADVHTVASADWIGGALVRTFPTATQYIGQ